MKFAFFQGGLCKIALSVTIALRTSAKIVALDNAYYSHFSIEAHSVPLSAFLLVWRMKCHLCSTT